MTTDTFRGRLGEQTYTDPALFALDVKAAKPRNSIKDVNGAHQPALLGSLSSGRLYRGRTPAQLTALTPLEREWLGCWVRTMTGREGQVWSLSDKPKAVWVIIDGEVVHCHTDYLAKLGGTAKDPEGLDVLEGL